MANSTDYVSAMDFAKQTTAVVGDGLATAFSVNGLTDALQGFGTAQAISNLHKTEYDLYCYRADDVFS